MRVGDTVTVTVAAGAFVAAGKPAIADATGIPGELQRVRDGGTIGAMTSIEKVLKCPVLFLGLSLPEHGYHAPNEYFLIESSNSKLTGFNGAVKSHVDFLFEIA